MTPERYIRERKLPFFTSVPDFNGDAKPEKVSPSLFKGLQVKGSALAGF